MLTNSRRIFSRAAREVATLASAFHDEKFIRQEVQQMCDWLESCTEAAPRHARV